MCGHSIMYSSNERHILINCPSKIILRGNKRLAFNFVEYGEYTGYSRDRVFPVENPCEENEALSDFLETATMHISDQDRVTHISK